MSGFPVSGLPSGGTNGQVLTISGGVPAWGSSGGFPLSTPLAGVAAGQVALAGTATFMTTGSLAVGTWAVEFVVAVAEGAGGVTSWGAIRVALGTATATFAGPLSAECDLSGGAVPNEGATLTLRVLVTVTVAGTILCQASGANVNANVVQVNSGYTGASGWTAERVA